MNILKCSKKKSIWNDGMMEIGLGVAIPKMLQLGEFMMKLIQM